MVKVRAMDLRTSWLFQFRQLSALPHLVFSAPSRFSLGSRSKLHLGELRRSTGGDLLAAEGGKLLLELIELLEEVLLGLRPQLSCFNAGLQSVASAKIPRPNNIPPRPANNSFCDAVERSFGSVPWCRMSKGDLSVVRWCGGLS